MKFLLNFKLLCTPMDKHSSFSSTGDTSSVPPQCWEGAQAGNSCRDGANPPGSLSCLFLLSSFLEFAFFCCCFLLQKWGWYFLFRYLWQPRSFLWILGPADNQLLSWDGLLGALCACTELNSQPGGQGMGCSGDSPCSCSALGHRG